MFFHLAAKNHKLRKTMEKHRKTNGFSYLFNFVKSRCADAFQASKRLQNGPRELQNTSRLAPRRLTINQKCSPERSEDYLGPFCKPRKVSARLRKTKYRKTLPFWLLRGPRPVLELMFPSVASCSFLYCPVSLCSCLAVADRY